jgi:hypothetical protein
MRRHRIQLLMSYFREYRSQCYLAQRATPRMPYPDFDPPPPSIIDGLDGMFDLRERSLLQDTFRLSVSRVFQSVGLSPMGVKWTQMGPLLPTEAHRHLVVFEETIFAKIVSAAFEDQLIAKETQTIGGLH